jgi:hypothetical protein
MKQILNLFLCLTLMSCVAAEVTDTPGAVNTKALPTLTSLPSIPIPSITPSVTVTAEIPCDPFIAEFCITEGHFILQRPIQPPGNDLVDPTYRYGSTANGTRDPHHGVEFPNPSGTPVHAAADGIVIFAGPDEEAIYAPWGNFYGNLVVIEHHDDLFTLYAHLSQINVEQGQKLLVGEKIGEVGRTGGAIGSHLHFEVRRGKAEDYFATQNPELWLSPAKDMGGNPFGTLVISLVDGDVHFIKSANFTIGYYSDWSQPLIRAYYMTAYSPDLLDGRESVALGELLAGHYRIAVETNGQIMERLVDVEWGKLTQVVFVK